MGHVEADADETKTGDQTKTDGPTRRTPSADTPDQDVADTESSGPRGRPAATSRHELSRLALDLFARQGYDETTVDDIASAAGIGRRTFFRYFDAKPDAVWGEFDDELVRLADRLAEAPEDEPMLDVLRRAVMATNRFGAGELDELRQRMSLIGSVPDLVAHSAVRYEAWCDVVATFAAGRLGCAPGDLEAQTVARAALGAAMAAFSSWASTGGGDLVDQVDRAFRLLATGLVESPSPR